MTNQEFLQLTIDAAPHTAAGLQKLRARVPQAESDLQNARQALQALVDEGSKLDGQRAAVEGAIVEMNQQLVASKATVSATFLAHLAGRPAPLDEVMEKRFAIFQRQQIAMETLEHLNTQTIDIAARQLEASISVCEKSEVWVRVAGMADVFDLYLTFLPVLARDPSVSFDVGAGSKLAAYTLAVNNFVADAALLRERLREAKALAGRN